MNIDGKVAAYPSGTLASDSAATSRRWTLSVLSRHADSFSSEIVAPDARVASDCMESTGDDSVTPTVSKDPSESGADANITCVATLEELLIALSIDLPESFDRRFCFNFARFVAADGCRKCATASAVRATPELACANSALRRLIATGAGAGGGAIAVCDCVIEGVKTKRAEKTKRRGWKIAAWQQLE